MVAGPWMIPALYGAAVVASAALLMASFGNFFSMKEEVVHPRGHTAMAASIIAGGALVALVGYTNVYLAMAAIGFVLSFIGSGFSHVY